MENPLRSVSTEEDLAYMEKHREKVIAQVGEELYEELVEKLRVSISQRRKPQLDE